MGDTTFDTGKEKYQNGSSSRSSISSATTATVQEENQKLGGDEIVMERKVGLTGAISLVVGVIIGSGIFISPTGVAANAGSVGLSLILWGVGGIITIFGALSMAELGTMIQTSGGEYTYIKISLADWLAYLWSWTQCLLLKPAGHAVIMLTCAEYILVPVYNDGCGGPPEMHKKMLSAVLCLLIALINIWSVALTSSIQIIFTVAKIIALIIIIVGGIVNMVNGKLDILKTGFEGTNTNPGEIMLGLYSAMFAYDGWTNLNAVTEEVIDPEKTLPLAMYIGIPLIMVLYMLANVSYFTVMSVDGLVNSPAVAMTWAESVIPQASWVIPLAVAMSTFGGVNGSIFSVGRLFYTSAKGGHSIKILSYLHVDRVTPMPAIIVTTLFTILYSLIGQVTMLIDFLSFAIWLFYAITMIALIVMRYREPYKSFRRPYKVPIPFPFIVFLFSAAMVIIPIATAPQIEFLYATILILVGLVFYFPFIFCKKRAPCMKEVTKFFQLLMQLVPPGGLDEEEDLLKSLKKE